MGLKSAKQDTEGYFDGLPQSTQDIVKDLISETISGHDLYGDREAEQLECRSRDGFIASSHNRGGLVINDFTDLGHFWGGGYSVSHEGAQKEIERQIKSSFEFQADDIFSKYETLLKSKGIAKEQCNYHDLTELAEKDSDLNDVAAECENTEMNYLSDDQSSIMYQVRFMYHGQDEKGNHTASVSCAVNTEGPYHRSSISWLPGAFCEGAKEVEISWKTEKQLQTRLAKTLKAVSAEIF